MDYIHMEQLVCKSARLGKTIDPSYCNISLALLPYHQTQPLQLVKSPSFWGPG